MIRRKLIEVALPLEAINREAAREKSIRHGHPSTLHLWWARRPLAACRAVLFASLVDDPSSRPAQFPTEEAQDAERQRLFRIIEELVKWDNSNNERVLEAARAEIGKSTGDNPPPVLDPFCGGGSIPLEAQRLGLEAHASDLNPVAVLITKALIEIPPRFAGRPPVNPEADKRLAQTGSWIGVHGLAEDLRYYGLWLRNEAEKRIGHLYPKIRLPKEHGGSEATAIAWIWARTVRCPNPGCRADMPLVRSFLLAMKAGKEAWIEPVVDNAARSVRLEVRSGKGTPQEGTVTRRGARCIVCNSSVPLDYIRDEGKQGRLGARLMAIVAQAKNSRAYLTATPEHESRAAEALPKWVPETELPEHALGFRVQLYGMTKHRDLFTQRQLTALTTFCDLVSVARERILADALANGMSFDKTPLVAGGAGASAYADAVATYLALAVSKTADYLSTLCTWMPGLKYEVVGHTFTRQSLPMTWDFAEANPFAGSSGDYYEQLLRTAKVLDIAVPVGPPGLCQQLTAAAADVGPTRSAIVVTDPPYYDNIGYSDLADFFYIWLRGALQAIYPDLFSTLLCPKKEELVATPFRFQGDKRKAEEFFEEGFRSVFRTLGALQNSEYPLSLYYAFKQAEENADDDGGTSIISSTGWETMLEALLAAGLTITGTWPVRTERGVRSVGIGTNALASSIVLVCRPRPAEASLATRAEFLRLLKSELPRALRSLQHGNIAPVDLAQAAIGPGMGVFSQYAKVLEADGSPMRVRTALGLINQILDEVLAEQEGEFDAATRWAVAWFEQFGMNEGPYGVAETLSKAKNASVEALRNEGVLRAAGGKVRLLNREELDPGWDPTTDRRLTVWEIAQYLVRALEKEGERGAAALLRRIGSLGEIARDLTYRLFTTCERKKWASEALAYNSLVVAWPEIVRLAAQRQGEEQKTLGV